MGDGRAAVEEVDVVDLAALSSRAQIHRLRRVAWDVLAQYQVEVARLRVLVHGHNTTFRVDAADGARYALRINVASKSTLENLSAEVAWLTALATDTDVSVPEPQPTRDGRLHTCVHSSEFGRDFAAALMSWLPGRDLGDRAPEALGELGRLTAALHDHAAEWSPPGGTGFPSHANVLVEDERRVFGEHPLLTPQVRDVVDAAYAETQARFDELWAGQRARPIHADLHPGNLKWRRGRLAVFDFDDAMMGIPVLDLGISAYYLTAGQQVFGVDIDLDHLFRGYETVRRLPAWTDRQFAAILAGRNLLLVNEMLGAVNAELVRTVEQYVANSTIKLRAYLETGTYRHDVDGVVPIAW